MFLHYVFVWQGDGICHLLEKFWSQAVKLNKIFISKNWVWKTCVSPLETGGFKVDRKQDWRVYVFIILSCITPQQQGKECQLQCPKQNLYEWVIELREANQVSFPLILTHICIHNRKGVTSQERTAHCGKWRKKIQSKESWDAAEPCGVFIQACWMINPRSYFHKGNSIIGYFLKTHKPGPNDAFSGITIS